VAQFHNRLETKAMETLMNTTETVVGELSEADCAARLAKLWNEADVHSFYPCDSSTVVAVLRDGGRYDVSTELLEAWARSKSVGTVAIRSGKFEWHPSTMLAAGALANASRLWLLDGIHFSKMTGCELADLQARAVGQSLFSDLDDVDIRSLIGVISNTAEREQRSALCCGLIAKLRKDGVIV